MSRALETVKRKFTRSGKDTQFAVGWLGARAAVDAVRAIDQYNYFSGDAVADTIGTIAAHDENARFAVGREGSPVVYVETRQPGVATGAFGNMDELRRPDELGEEDAVRYGAMRKRRGHTLVRAWWD